MRKLSWKPIKKGNKYCSSACGHGCTMKEYKEALKLGEDALKTIRNKNGWKVRVWENMGWHVQLYKNGINVHIDKGLTKNSFSVLANTYGEIGGGDTLLLIKKSFNSAQKAIDSQMKIISDHVKKINKWYEKFD